MNNVREIALDILMQIEKNQAYSNLLLNQKINKHRLSQKDSGLLTEIVYGTIQRRDTLDYYLAPFIKKGRKMDSWVHVLLRLSLYQMVYLDRVPDRAILFEAVEIAKRKGHKGIASMVNGVLRTIQREGIPSLDDVKDPVKKLALETSHPYWLVSRWVKQLGIEETEKMCFNNLVAPSVTARVNTSKTTVENVIEMLNEEGVTATTGDLAPNSIQVEKGNPSTTLAFKEGYFTIQDESSMLVSHALGVQQEDHVLDSCAAPGGKTTHIAELLNNTGSVTSIDLHDHKVKLIRNVVDRLQLKNVTTKAMDSRRLSDEFEPEIFDRILVDAPCSGLGVLRRKPDIKYTKSEEDIKNLSAIQYDILTSASSLLKGGGTLVYSTCTIDSEENEQVINKFLDEHPQFSLDETLVDRMPYELTEKNRIKDGFVQILPHDFGTDGFFIACIRKQV
jgi:16S rRNA (cytosine967-C5)-methyltransferase